MKGQDILLLLKLISLQKLEKRVIANDKFNPPPQDWQDWDDLREAQLSEKQIFDTAGLDSFREGLYTLRSLELSTGISKTQVGESLKRCIKSGLAKPDRKYGIPRANDKNLLEFIIYGLKYVFPVRAGELTRGIATSFAAPVLQGKLFSAGDLSPVWPDPRAKSKGLAVEPIYHSVPFAVRNDKDLYAMLALTDGIRLGNPRESSLAAGMLETAFKE